MGVWLRRAARAAAALVVLALAGRATAAPAVATVPASQPPSSDTPIADHALREAVEAALSHAHASPESGAATRPVVAVEILTADGAAVARTVASLGGAVTGTVDGAVVQAVVPAARVEQLASAAGVDFVQSPRRVTRPPAASPARAEVGPGLGSTVGDNVAVTNASAWQAAGIDGSVKVGILDYFDLGLWSPAENGPVPDAGHRFCLDTSGAPEPLCPFPQDGVNDFDGFEHGVAVAQIVKDMAPGAELYIASAGTVSDTVAAIDFFAANGVQILTRSLGAAYDGPGDGSGPLDAVVDYAASKGIVWFNSAGNDAVDGYVRVTVPTSLAAGQYVDFDPGPGVDTLLRVSGDCIVFDGIRWSDWNLPASQRSDYRIEAWAPTSDPDHFFGEQYNPPDVQQIGVSDSSQPGGAPPLEVADESVCPVPNDYGFANGIIYIRVRLNNSVGAQPDVLEVGLGFGIVELGRGSASYSAAKPVVDSRNTAMISVGAVDPANGSGAPDAIAPYSSQGPTNDGRVKPDVAAPSCVANTLYPGCFNGTSAASPTAAGVAALLLDAGVALPGVPLAAAVRHFVLDRPAQTGGGPDGADNKYGAGEVRLPSAPGVVPASVASTYHPLTPVRILDTCTSSPVGAPIGAQPPYGIIDVQVTGVAGIAGDATAVALNLTSTGNTAGGFIQAVPFLRSPLGASSTLNVGAGATQPNFAIVPVGQDGKISVYVVPGGDVIIDVLGYFSPTNAEAVAAGRFVPIDPVRALDTRTTDLVPAGWVAHKPAAESVVVPPAQAVPGTGVAALVLNVTSTEASAAGFLRAEPTGTAPPSSTVNYAAGVDSANTVIVPLGAGGTVSVYTNNSSHIVVDITGYITDATAAPSSSGRYVAVATARAYDSRAGGGVLAPQTSRTVQLTGLAGPGPVVPPSASGISLNLTATDEGGPGFLSAYPAGGNRPATSSLNYVGALAIANGGLLKLSPGGALDVFTNQPTQFIIDVNGYFT